MQFGISTFGEVGPAGNSRNHVQSHERVQQLLQLAVKADEWGLDVLALGEHHRRDFVISSPEMILAAAAARTKNIRLSSAVTVLSSADPVRVFQNFATLDLISSGRAEIMAGRGSFIESFPLFGYDLQDYDALFIEKLDLLLEIRAKETIHWQGRFRPRIQDQAVYPRPMQQPLPVWIAVGGTPASVIRAATMGLPLTIAILGSSPARFKALTDLYRQQWAAAGHPENSLQLCINEHLYIAENRAQAIDDYWPVYGAMMNRIGRERGWPAMDKDHFKMLCGPEGPLMVGTADEVAQKLLYQHKLFGYSRFLAQIIYGEIPNENIERSVELFATSVVPKIKKGLNE